MAIKTFLCHVTLDEIHIHYNLNEALLNTVINSNKLNDKIILKMCVGESVTFLFKLFICKVNVQSDEGIEN